MRPVQEFLSSVEGMGSATSRVLAIFRELGVEPIIESKVGLEQHCAIQTWDGKM